MAINEADIKICSNALQVLGADPINSFDDETRESQICASIYPLIKRNTLQKHYWRFSIRQEQLSQLVATPLYDFRYAYQLPNDFLRFVGKQNPSINHQIFENKIYTDVNPLFISMQYEASAQYFPSYFEYLLQLELMKELALGLMEDESKEQRLAAKAREQLIAARTIDSQNNTVSIIPNELFTLTSVRQ